MTEPHAADVEDERVVAEDPDFPPPGTPTGPCDLSAITLHMVGHAHIDLGYRWNQAETVHYVSPWTFRGVLDLMDRVPEFTFCQSQMYLYEAMRREYPDIFARMLDKIRAGTWEVVGGTWSEYDAILPSGEAVIRQYLHGVRYARDILGAPDQRVAFVPDSFCGHAATLPQILAGCGFQYYVFGRGLTQDPDAPQDTRRAFRWIGPDGSAIVAYLPFGPYSTPPLTPEFLKRYKPYVEAAVSTQELVLHGQGDHGGGPRDAEIEALGALGDLPNAPRWRYSTVHQLCDAAFDAETVAGLGEHRGNLGGFATGSLTSQAQVKRRNRILERQLLAAEASAVIDTLLSRKPAYPRTEVKELWRLLLTEQFHDILPGTSVASVYRDTHAAYDQVEEGTDWLLSDAFGRLASRLDTRGDDLTVVAFNSGLNPSATPVSVEVPDWAGARLPAQPRLTGPDGEQVPCHLEDGDLVFPVDLPPLGYATYRLAPASAGDAPQALASSAPGSTALPSAGLVDGRLDAAPFCLTFCAATGDLLGLEHVPTGRQLLSGPSNTLDLHREMSIATSWVHGFNGQFEPLRLLEPPALVEDTPLVKRVVTVSRSGASTLTREVALWAGTGRVDFQLSADWHEGNAFLKLGFEPALSAPTVTAAIAHGTVAIDDPAREFCVHDYVRLDAPEGGLAFINDGAYGCDLADGRLGISCIRTVRDMDPSMSHGQHELRYSLVPLEAGASESSLLRHVGGFCHQVLTGFEPSHPGGIKSWGRFDNSQALPRARAFVALGCDHAALCALKVQEEDWQPTSFVIRVREVDGLAGQCWIDLPAPVSRAVLADHLERETGVELKCRDGRVHLPLAPRQIATAVAYV